MNELFNKFSLSFKRQRADIVIPGSPERCIARFAAEDMNGIIWLVEKLQPAQTIWRNTVGTMLTELSRSGTPHIHPPAHTADGETVIIHKMAPYQLTPFIAGTELPRPEYCAEPERGKAIGEFLIALQENGKSISIPKNSTPPLPEYIADVVSTIQKREPAIYKRVKNILPHLEDFFAAYDAIPTALAHGDCHPINIIWNGTQIAGVIDWEFTGNKMVLYDAANCIGCVGFEHPNWLINGLVPQLLGTLYKGSNLFAANTEHLIPAVLALRFAWLSEWLRKRDPEMQEMELDYMDILANHKIEIEQHWKRQFVRNSSVRIHLSSDSCPVCDLLC